jgi:hypothetical protein
LEVLESFNEAKGLMRNFGYKITTRETRKGGKILI